MNPTLVAILSSAALAAGDLLMRKLGSAVGVGLIVLASNLALLVVVVVALAILKKGLWPARWGLALAAGVTRMGAIICAVLALRQLEVSQYYMVLYLFPMWVMIGGVVFFREIPRKLQVTGLVLALTGSAVVFGGGGVTMGPGVIAALACGLFLSAQILVLRKIGRESPLKVSLVNSLVGITGGVALMLMASGGAQSSLSASALWLLAALVAVNIISPIGSFYAAGRLKAFVYALLGYLQIPMALVGAWLAFGEGIGGSVAIGLVLLVLGSLTSQLPEKVRKA